MKRLRRWLFNVLAGLSLLLCVAAAAFWVRSHWRWDEVSLYDGTNVGYDLFTWNGGLYFVRMTNSNGTFIRLRAYSVGPTVPGSVLFQPPRWSLLGFEAGDTLREIFNIGKVYQSVNSGHYVLIPYWAIIVLSGVGPGLWLMGYRRRHILSRRMRRGVCWVCGYDLRATPDRCPECGTIPPEKKIISN
jgi:hypothetical protein